MSYLYHYTKLSNLKKIIMSNVIDIIATYYQKHAADDYAWIKENAEPIIKEICETNNWHYDIEHLSYNPYIISFCKSPTSKYMWNHFGDNGEGVVLVLNQERLRQEADSFDNYACLVPCEYLCTESDRKHVKEMILRISNNELLNNCSNDDKLIFAVMGVMQNKFYNEMEVRYVQIEERVFTASCDNGKVKIDDYIVSKDNWERHVLFSKDILEGVIFGKYVDNDDIVFYKDYLVECGYDHIFIQQAK